MDPDGAGPAAHFEIPDRDFDYRSLLGNAVLRWEWRPGSTLFLIWQQSRDLRVTPRSADPGDGPVGRLDLGRDPWDLLGLPPDNIFMAKVNYWLNP